MSFPMATTPAMNAVVFWAYGGTRQLLSSAGEANEPLWKIGARNSSVVPPLFGVCMCFVRSRVPFADAW